MPRTLRIFLWLGYVLAVALPWTGIPWRAFSIPAGAVVVLLAAGLAVSPEWRRGFAAAAGSLEACEAGRLAWRAAALFFIWLASLKLCQYAAFQSHYGDLGQDANICWNTLHGRPFLDSVAGINFLGDHFEPVLALCALGFKVWPSAGALLLIQSLALALALVPLAGLARLHARSNAGVLAFAILFALNPFLHMVSEFDFHPEALFIPAAFWALLLWERRRPWLAGLVVLPCLGIKEDVTLALAGFGLYAAWDVGAASPGRRKAGGALFAAGIAAFAVIALWIIPHFAGSRVSAHHDRYASLGLTTAAMIRNVAQHPWIILLRLLRPRVLLTYGLLLGSAGFLPLAAPVALVPVGAACLHHLLSDYHSQYALVSQYSAQTLPFLFYAALLGWSRGGQSLGRQRWLPAAFVFLCGLLILFQPQYTRSFQWRNVRQAQRLLGQVPEGVPVATDGSHGAGDEDPLAHLALRRELLGLCMSQPFRAPQAQYVLLDAQRWQPYARYLAAVAGFERLGVGDGLELWRQNRSAPPP